MVMCFRTNVASALQGPSCVCWLELQSITLNDTSQQHCLSGDQANASQPLTDWALMNWFHHIHQINGCRSYLKGLKTSVWMHIEKLKLLTTRKKWIFRLSTVSIFSVKQHLLSRLVVLWGCWTSIQAEIHLRRICTMFSRNTEKP